MTGKQSHRHAQLVMAGVIIGISCSAVSAAVTVLGTQYQQDELFPQYNCIWHDKNYPTSCSGTYLGGNLHVYLKNTGSSAVSISDMTLAGHSLKTVLVQRDAEHSACSIYYYWDVPPADILAAGTPVWFKGDPATIPPGGVAQAVMRVRSPPTTPTVNVGVLTTGGDTTNVTIAVDANAPQLANVGFSQDRAKVYLHWRRSGGAAPTTIKMDGNDVTASTVTVGDASVNYAESVINLSTPLAFMSYHVFQGVYSDGKTASASLRAWSHQFIHAPWGTFPCEDTVCGRQFVDDCLNRGLNAIENQSSSGVGAFLSSLTGKAYAEARGFGRIVWNKDIDGSPWQCFINDEVDAEEDNVGRNFCGTGKKLPCGASPMGILGMRSIAVGEDFRSKYPNAATTINMDGTFKPENYYAYGQAVDVLQVDPYYQKRLKDTYWYHDPAWVPLYNKATYIYAVSMATARAAEPNSAHVILQSTETKENVNGVTKVWPFATPQCKRIEAYYALAGGAKGLSYWWFNVNNGYGSNGLGAQTPTAMAVWKEMGMYGNEIKTISPLLVTSHPVAMTLAPSNNVWAKALAVGTDTIILLAVNDNYYNDANNAFIYAPVSNANVVATLPSWMMSSTPTAFEVRTSGLYDVTTSLSNSNLTVQLGTLDITRMIVITKDPTLRSTIQSRYVNEVWPGVCNFAPEKCVPQTAAPTIAVHPSDQTTTAGGSATFTVVSNGSAPLTYLWQKNTSNLANGGHYSGATSATLTISQADTNDAANYRCVVTNTYGTATSNAASLAITIPTGPTITQQPVSQAVAPAGTVTLNVGATGVGTLRYQWQKNQAQLANGGHYSGAMTASLTISNADSNDTANYSCVVTDDIGIATSSEATLTVALCPPPVFANGSFEASLAANPPSGWTTYTQAGASGSWTIQSVAPPQGTQWQQSQVYTASSYGGIRQNVTGLIGGQVYTVAGSYKTNTTSATASVRYNLSGSDDRTASTALVSKTDSNWTTFSGTVTASGSSLSLFLDHLNSTFTNKASGFDNITVTLTGCSTPVVPTITQQPTAQNICPGANASFTVAATGTAPLSYLWQKNSVNLANGGHYAGVTTVTLAITGADSNDAANYRCVVSNGGGSVTSSQAALSLKAATVITVQPSNQAVIAGGTTSLTLTATGTGTLTYQWQKNSDNLADGGHYSGVTTATLTITGADGTDGAIYRCVVTGGCGNITSDEVSVTVNPPQPGDFDSDGDVDATDLANFAICGMGPELMQADVGCATARLDADDDVDSDDYAVFQRCYSGENVPGDPACAD